MKYAKILVIAIVMMSIGKVAFAEKLILHKVTTIRKPKIHPYTYILEAAKTHSDNLKRGFGNNKLLVILVDFEKETTDNPNTTGNGKFLMEADASYRTNIAAPPHDKAYFESNLDALRYYYLAASQNTFNLQYDVWPKNQTAYTLPHEMGYYNPVGASSELFLSRMEEYFKSSFETADATDPAIDFSIYSHFMIIHAGSDWQHDVLGDTPSDLPSFYINVAPGKEAVVDDGHIQITHACNVPSTISQDFNSYESGGKTYYTGYGALNGVMAHEFGHSMGLVDLYNTYNSAPMVGQFDIMDSGGSVVTEDSSAPGVLVEGTLPALPGAFSRELMFGDEFKTIGLMKEINSSINQTNLSSSFTISASSQKQIQGNIVPNIYKIPLNDHEYILLENRSVDPDGDGGTIIKGTPDRRVVLYPTAIDDPNDTPTYEYDYLLPSFVDAESKAIGGGLLVWHVDEKRLYYEGKTDNDGVFTSNFEQNTVNYSRSHRSVSIIEADGLDDIGNDNSWFWSGTPFEYFHKFKPVLGQMGQFINWSTLEWKPALDSESNPALVDFAGHPSFFGIQQISQPLPRMSFMLSAGMFDKISSLSGSDASDNPLPVINSSLVANVLPVLRDNRLHFYFYDSSVGFDTWTEAINPVDLPFSNIAFEPIVTDINNDSFKELVICNTNSICIIDMSNDTPNVTTYSLINGNTIVSAPLCAFGKLWIATTSGLQYLTSNSRTTLEPTNITGSIKLAADEAHLIIQQLNKLIVVNPQTFETIETYRLPSDFTHYDPLIIKQSQSEMHPYYYLSISDKGDIYKSFDGKVECIFHNNIDVMPTNLAVTGLSDYSPVIFFGLANQFYGITLNGTLLPGYPHYYDDYNFKPYSYIKIKQDYNHETSEYPVSIYLNLTSGGLVAINSNGEINLANSMIDMNTDVMNQTYWYEDKLYWFLNLYQSGLCICQIDNVTQRPIIWNGFRNYQNGFIELAFSQPPVEQRLSKVYAFPNPTKDGWIRLRVVNPSGDIKLQVFNITGTELFTDTYTSVQSAYQDIYLDLSKYSSGVYSAAVKCNGHIERCKFAIEK